MSQRVVWLDQEGIGPEEVGGKAAPLGRLLQAGLPVPAGFCVTVSAFREALAPIQAAIDLPLARLSGEKSPDLDGLSEEIGRQLQDLALPAGLLAEVRAAYEELAMAGGQSAVCVRSSAVAEDLPGATFAGLHDSFLNVLDFDALVVAMRRCWTSLWSPRALSYHRARGLEGHPYLMALLVQPLLLAESAGVLFTRDPVTGDGSRISIQSAWGLGETVVQGTGGADTLVFTREAWALESSRAARKERLVTAAPEGGLHTVPVPEELRDLPSLSEEAASHLFQMALDTERVLGEGQDIEWALAEGRLSLLQSRPVVLPEVREFPIQWDAPEDALVSWTLDLDTVQRPYSPLEQDLRSLWMGARLASLDVLPGLQNRFDYRFFNGYLYMRRLPDPMDASERERRRQAYDSRIADLGNQGKTLWEAEIFPEIEANLNRLQEVSFHGASGPALLDHLQDLLRTYQRHWTLHWLMGTQPLRNRWERAYQELTGEPLGERGTALLAGSPHLTRQMLDGLIGLARAAQEMPGVLRTLRDDHPADALGHLAATPEGIAFLHQVWDFLSDFGLRTGHGFGSASSWRTPTWLEEPALVLEVVKTYLDMDLGALGAQERWLLERREAEEAESLARIPTEVGRQRFRRELDLARRADAVMEDHNFYIEQMTDGYLRLCLVEAGHHLAGRGVLVMAEDVFFLTLEEAQALLKGEQAGDIAARVEGRQRELSRWGRLTPPRFVGAPAPESPRQEIGLAQTASHTLSGTAASAGVARGRARVVEADRVVPTVEGGDILVASNAGPLWVPMLPVLGGMVLDQGVLFQHAASIAREYGVPAVIETRVATQAIRDGQTITVDGDRGTVYLEVGEDSS